ncbi:hypothetical protein AB4455_26220 [Vibrio sp. 10N.261.46.E12]|uniref:hypothetical protein n=1 Tax=unclassified Vibrio TaxID=2614977 RepID=UPI00097871AD|nr:MULTISPECIES: hypothetical protein [unclassified Vibrio]OMO37697.1 hypothetical protein BH584_21430 [Vibrio sp. 10N.261.45.E1]PMJ36885.1 hypothetical protein BCU27_22695 [Vibrio sp. 10N.286.45.B6]PML93600.1 hypothetical protein BCT66_24350 [Vibrio sp. 10N.261.49.E11]PMM86143.1 hypothetical protein BCT46_08650 [Vibrio sp. 10N.261.46.E8]PMN50172.1 hypothetical protein BCT32_04850 [Vibrio sp. 10N.261.45.E11]
MLSEKQIAMMSLLLSHMRLNIQCADICQAKEIQSLTFYGVKASTATGEEFFFKISRSNLSEDDCMIECKFELNCKMTMEEFSFINYELDPISMDCFPVYFELLINKNSHKFENIIKVDFYFHNARALIARSLNAVTEVTLKIAHATPGLHQSKMTH